MYSTRNELQNVADAAALAGAGELGRIYLTLSTAEQRVFDVNQAGYKTQIQTEVENTAVQNKAAEVNISISPADIIIGTWDWTSTNLSTALTPANITPDAVRVVARRDSSSTNKAVTTFFGFIFSFFGGSADTFEVSAVATAALSGASSVAEGVLKTPFAISENTPCTGPITFNPTGTSCAGWHNFIDPMSGSALPNKMLDVIEGYDGINPPGSEGHQWFIDHYNLQHTPSPEINPGLDIGDMITTKGGTIANVFTGGDYYDTWTGPNTNTGVIIGNPGNLKSAIPLINLFDFFRYRDGDDPGTSTGLINTCKGFKHHDDVWTATVPMYKEAVAGCTNPSSDREIIGFAKVQILKINQPPLTSIDVCLDCNFSVEAGRGGGGTSGHVMGHIPNLVQ